jgi:hypothetical protein
VAAAYRARIDAAIGVTLQSWACRCLYENDRVGERLADLVIPLEEPAFESMMIEAAVYSTAAVTVAPQSSNSPVRQ